MRECLLGLVVNVHEYAVVKHENVEKITLKVVVNGGGASDDSDDSDDM